MAESQIQIPLPIDDDTLFTMPQHQFEEMLKSLANDKEVEQYKTRRRILLDQWAAMVKNMDNSLRNIDRAIEEMREQANQQEQEPDNTE